MFDFKKYPNYSKLEDIVVITLGQKDISTGELREVRLSRESCLKTIAHIGSKRASYATQEGFEKVLSIYTDAAQFMGWIKGVIVGEPRVTCFISELDKTDDGEYIMLLCKEGEKGYWRTEYNWGKDKEVAQELVDEKNRMLGLSPEEAVLIQLGTM